jgi:hypothetical protein
MAITKQKYIIGSTLQTPTPWNRNLGFFGSGTTVGQIVLNFQSLVTAAGGILETATCTQNVITGLQNIPGDLNANSAYYIALSLRTATTAQAATFESFTCTQNSVAALIGITS